MIVLREQLNWRTIAGGVTIMLGIAFIVVEKARKTKPVLLTEA
jgi:drug/metabolite transporter (DMT)-like permease